MLPKSTLEPCWSSRLICWDTVLLAWISESARAGPTGGWPAGVTKARSSPKCPGSWVPMRKADRFWIDDPSLFGTNASEMVKVCPLWPGIWSTWYCGDMRASEALAVWPLAFVVSVTASAFPGDPAPDVGDRLQAALCEKKVEGLVMWYRPYTAAWIENMSSG